MPNTQDLLDILLSWDRNNTILLSLLGALPQGGLEARAMKGGPCVAELFTHIHFVRLIFVFEDAPEFARELSQEEWAFEPDSDRIVQMLNDSATAGFSPLLTGESFATFPLDYYTYHGVEFQSP